MGEQQRVHHGVQGCQQGRKVWLGWTSSAPDDECLVRNFGYFGVLAPRALQPNCLICTVESVYPKSCHQYSKMRVIITGATGLVGSAVVRQCIVNQAITEALILTRKPLPRDISNNAKIAVIIHEDFGSYPPELLTRLSGAEGCIWCVYNDRQWLSNANNGKQDSRRARLSFP